MESFLEYTSDQRILNLLAKERAKLAVKRKSSTAVNPARITEKVQKGEHLSVEDKLFTIMPPRDRWVRPRKKDRTVEGEKKSPRAILKDSILLTIRKDSKSASALPYLRNLDTFISEIRTTIKDNTELTFRSMEIIPKKKGRDGDITIMRPICAFTDLKEKILISLASSYLSEAAENVLHEEILSYRPPRFYHGSERKILTSRENAVDSIDSYRSLIGKQDIYVAECDIKKYYDSINHDIVRNCFNDLADRLSGSGFTYGPARRILDAYLNSYSFFNNVAEKELPEGERFDIPSPEAFINAGCYKSIDDFNSSKSKIGIPQGGALSSVISNVIMNSIDRGTVLKENDPDRFFCRYGDDILLMHTDKDKCSELITEYSEGLKEAHFLCHGFIDISSYKTGEKTTCGLWEQKSKNPFLWGRGEDDSADWIGFLGYELRYTGEIRIRRSSFDEKCKRIKRSYRSAIKAKIANGLSNAATYEELEKKSRHTIERFRGNGLTGAAHLTANKYSGTQAGKLDGYTRRHIRSVIRKISRHNQIEGLAAESLQSRLMASLKPLISECCNYKATLHS